MRDLQIKPIKNLLQVDITYLIEESKEEGFHFLLKLINEYKNNTNTFSGIGECLYGIFQDDVLIGIAGVNQDPYSKNNKIGRLRRFYVSKAYRQKGVGSLLLKRMLCEAKEYFQVVVLYTDTKRASQFYVSNGFVRSEKYLGSNYYFRL